MNTNKCAFGVSASQFLGFLVHERRIEIGLKSQEAVRTMVPPTMKKELQQLIGKINFVKRFISNLSEWIKPFMDLVKIKADEEFHWGPSNNERSKKSKNIWQDHPCWFLPSRTGHSIFICSRRYLHRLGSGTSMDGKEKVVFYLSRRMLDTETRYHEI
jgi:hypothetical protein